MRRRYTVKRRRMGTVHIVRWWEVYCDGVHIDTYADEDRDMAHAYVKYMNGPRPHARADHRGDAGSSGSMPVPEQCSQLPSETEPPKPPH